MPNKILVFYGSYRRDRMGIRLADYLVAQLKARGEDAELIDAKAVGLPMLDRMQDGPLIEHDTLVLSFVALPDHRAKLTGFRRFLMRRQGVVPGDIVYDYEAAHLLHSFIARAATPVFYDALDEDGLNDLIDKLVIAWPKTSTHHIRDASDPMLEIVAAEAVLATPI